MKKPPDLFTKNLERELERVQSLAARMRPAGLEDFFGQEHLLSPGKPLWSILDRGVLTSLVFWGPPGTGKTSLARIIARRAEAQFEEYSAVTSQVSDIRRVVHESEDRLGAGGARTIIFIDEFHRFNKAQQDAFLPHLESGLLTLIGATTENPYFVLNPALRSRVTIYHFDRLGEPAMRGLIESALRRAPKELNAPAELPEDALAEVLLMANGDARVALNLLEMSLQLAPGAVLTAASIRETAAARQLDYGRLGTDRFDMVSAFIKSLRGSDPDAALHWMCRLLEGGEDPAFIARRMVIFSAEDIGCAAPQAITVAAATVQAVTFVGMPEAQIPLASCAVYLATSPKSNRAYKALHLALDDVRNKPLGPVPLHLRNQDFTKQKGAADRYKYPHDYPGHFVPQAYLPPGLECAVYYEPSGEGHETGIAARLNAWRAAGGKSKKPAGKKKKDPEKGPPDPAE